MVADKPIRVLTAAAVLLVAAIAAVVSFVHIEHLAITHGQTALAAGLLPLSIDGTVAAASLAMLRAARAGHAVAGQVHAGPRGDGDPGRERGLWRALRPDRGRCCPAGQRSRSSGPPRWPSAWSAVSGRHLASGQRPGTRRWPAPWPRLRPRGGHGGQRPAARPPGHPRIPKPLCWPPWLPART
ncbi:MAG TPA: DUF2637 domain-containing protein [Streptosporangiaceae bacterium]|nr:DUF2637 domain-containing protein [Streptosporangiaceae bacterium]